MSESTCDGACACSSQATQTPAMVSRRGVLVGSAAAVAAVALAACSSDSGTGAGGGSTTVADGQPLAKPADIAVGGGVVVTAASGPVVITHPTDSEFKAFNGRCPHQGCPVSSVAENVITCTCHGSTFDAVTGDRIGGPAPTGLEPIAVRSDGQGIFLS